jgi:hypothetical protein
LFVYIYIRFFILKRFIVSWSNISVLSSSACAIKAGLIISGIPPIGSSIQFSINGFSASVHISINEMGSSIGSNIGSYIGSTLSGSTICIGAIIVLS